MTIVFLTRRFWPQIGGVEKHVLEISKRLVKKGHKVVIITELEKNTNDRDKQSLIESARLTGKVTGIEIYHINPGNDDWFKKFRIWKELWGFRKLLSSADVVHCHDVFFWYLPFRFLYLSKKVYITFHGYEGNFIPTRKAILMHKLGEKLSKGNICIGKFFERWYGTKPTYISYGAVDEKLLKGQKVTDKKMITFVGRLEEETGIMEYLKAFKKISESGRFKLDILGEGSLMGEARRYVEVYKLPVNFRGFVDNTAKFVERAYFVFTSRYLGMLEAMASKKYVLAVYNNKIKEDYLRMTPFSDWISISADADGIEHAFKKCLLDVRDTDAKITKAHDWVKTETWEKMVDLYLKLWAIE